MSDEDSPNLFEIFREEFHHFGGFRQGYRSPLGWIRVGTLAPIAAVGVSGSFLSKSLLTMKLERLAQLVTLITVLLCFVPFLLWITLWIGLPN